MPAGRPAFKQDRNVSSGEDRYAMTLLATADNPHFVASRFEVDREGITYTADTLRLLRSLYPENVEFYFITGADAITEIVSGAMRKTLRALRTLSLQRSGWQIWTHAWDAIDASGLAFDVTYLFVPALAISSSHLRERIKAGRACATSRSNPRDWLPPQARSYGMSTNRYGHTSEVVA